MSIKFPIDYFLDERPIVDRPIVDRPIVDRLQWFPKRRKGPVRWSEPIAHFYDKRYKRIMKNLLRQLSEDLLDLDPILDERQYDDLMTVMYTIENALSTYDRKYHKPQKPRYKKDVLEKTKRSRSRRKSKRGYAKKPQVRCKANKYDNKKKCWEDMIDMECIPASKLYKSPHGSCFNADQLATHIRYKQNDYQIPTYPDTNLPMSDAEIAKVLDIAD